MVDSLHAGDASSEVEAASLKVDGLNKSFGSVVAVYNVSLEASAGGAYGLIGPNGAGKSTLFDLITGVQPPDSGVVMIDGDDVTGNPAEELAARGVLRTYQHTSVFPTLTVEENLHLGGYLVDRRHPWDSIRMTKEYRRSRDELAGRTREVLELLGMENRASFEAQSLAYGELRYLEVAIALMSRPRLLMLDEPAAGLNAAEAERLKEILDMLSSDPRVTTIVVEHNVQLIMKACEVVWVLHHGELIAQGPPQEISKHPRVREVYLGV